MENWSKLVVWKWLVRLNSTLLPSWIINNRFWRQILHSFNLWGPLHICASSVSDDSLDNNPFSLFYKHHALKFLHYTLRWRRTKAVMLKIWHYLSYKCYFYLYVQRKTIAFLNNLRTLLEVSLGFPELNMLQLGVKRCSSVSPVCRYVLTIISVKISHKFEETLLTVRHIAVSLTFKWAVTLRGRLFWSDKQPIELSEKELNASEHPETPNTRKQLAMKSSIC